MDEYERLAVYDRDNMVLERFEECRATVNSAGLLIVMAGKEYHVFNQWTWSRVETVPLVRV